MELEDSDHHRSSILTYAFFASEKGRVDAKIEKQAKIEVTYRTKVLKLVVAIVKFLAE